MQIVYGHWLWLLVTVHCLVVFSTLGWTWVYNGLAAVLVQYIIALKGVFQENGQELLCM